MKFQYIGGDDNAPEVTTTLGLKFKLNGEAVEVEDERVIRKLEGNKAFRKVIPRKRAKRGGTSGRVQQSSEEVGLTEIRTDGEFGTDGRHNGRLY